MFNFLTCFCQPLPDVQHRTIEYRAFPEPSGYTTKRKGDCQSDANTRGK